MGVVQFFDEIRHRVLHARAETQIAALAPATHDVAAVLQEAAQRARRGVGGNKPGQYQYRMSVAARRQRQQRQRAEKGAEFMDGASLQKHQGPGRRIKRLRSKGHRISYSGRLLYVAAAGQWINGKT